MTLGTGPQGAPMPFTMDDFHDLIRLIETRPEWRAELRRLVLTDELLTVPDHLLVTERGAIPSPGRRQQRTDLQLRR